jgi:aspartate--ammonia ligase
MIKEYFQINLALELNLTRVTAPLFVPAGRGINDDLNGVEKPISFPIRNMDGQQAEIIQSLAKWKRLMLADYGFRSGEGLYTDMNAIRPDEILDNIHSLYVDQWDWELAINEENRTLEFLIKTVRTIYAVIVRTEKYMFQNYPSIEPGLPEEITFIHSEALEQAYPDLSPMEREEKAVREYGAVFVIGIGNKLESGQPHDGRAPDYDDWSTPTGSGHTGLNGDIIVYNKVLDRAFELSSMGIRVNRASLKRQLELTGTTERAKLLFHRRLRNGELPLSIGGGIGQSRLCMFYLRKAHIGEIQASIWPDDVIERCRQNNIFLL